MLAWLRSNSLFSLTIRRNLTMVKIASSDIAPVVSCEIEHARIVLIILISMNHTLTIFLHCIFLLSKCQTMDLAQVVVNVGRLVEHWKIVWGHSKHWWGSVQLQKFLALNEVFQRGELFIKCKNGAVFVRDILHQLSLSLKFFFLYLYSLFALCLILIL